MGNNVLGTPIVKGLGFNSFGIGMPQVSHQAFIWSMLSCSSKS